MSSRGPAHARDLPARPAPLGAPRRRTREQDVIESNLSVAIQRDLRDDDADELEVIAVAERLERHAPAADADWGACLAVARRIVEARR